MARYASLPDEDNEILRKAAYKLFVDKYDRNQSAFARALDTGNANIARFVIKNQGGVSTETGKKIAKLAGLPWPLTHANGTTSAAESAAAPRPATPPPPPLVQPESEAELEKTVEFFQNKWTPSTVEIARTLTRQGLQKSRLEWIDVLNKIQEKMQGLVQELLPDGSGEM